MPPGPNDLIKGCMMKKVLQVKRSSAAHWVGDGFPVRTIFSYNESGEELSPFLLLDYAGPAEFPPSDRQRGVEEHPHKGFETVTIVYSGEVEHRDSSGGGGLIGPGDVQWMTAASGLVHEEMHGREFARRGGLFEMVQLWVNLPAKDKQAKPGYQNITAAQIPRVELPGGAGVGRVIAGSLHGVQGPARTFTPINLWDIRLNAGHQVELPVFTGHTTALLVLKGNVRLNGTEPLAATELAVFDREGQGIAVEAIDETTLLVLDGQPIHEPIVGAGPFVMNTAEEIRQAYADYRNGKMGRLAAAAV
jgi:quercetin 2,3-dioxygenase